MIGIYFVQGTLSGVKELDYCSHHCLVKLMWHGKEG